MPEQTTRHPRPVGLWVGVILITVGVLALGWVTWQMVGTNVVAHHKQEQAVAEIREDWEKPRTPDTEAPGPSDGEAGQTDADGRDDAILRIPRFGEHWEMPIFESVSDTALASGVGHLPGSAKVGDTGNYAVAAHRVTHGEPFRNLPDLNAGDRIIIETRTMRYTYVLDTDGDARTVDFDDTWVLNDQPIPLPSRKVITLTTCAELFHTDNRLVAFGHLASQTIKSP